MIKAVRPRAKKRFSGATLPNLPSGKFASVAVNTDINLLRAGKGFQIVDPVGGFLHWSPARSAGLLESGGRRTEIGLELVEQVE